MRKTILISSITLILFLSVSSLLNMKVTTGQGINYKVSKMELPLYLKLLNFYGRHFNYKWLTRNITDHLKTKEEKIFRLFQWTHETIRKQPNDLPIMDDHVWNVYVRGYGVNDNFHDLFTTLCNYALADGFSLPIHIENSTKKIYLSFISIERGWVVFDPYHGIYFENKIGSWATISEIKKQNWKIAKLKPNDISESYYEPYLEVLPEIEKIGFKRANTQSPFNRLKLQLNNWVSGEKPLFE
jgi:hypothetical protein